MAKKSGSGSSRNAEAETEAFELAVPGETEIAEAGRQDSGGGGLFGTLGRVSSSALSVTREIGGSAQRLTQQIVSEAEHLVDVALTSEVAPRVVVHGEVIEEQPDYQEPTVATAAELRRAGDRLLLQSAEPAGGDAPHPAFEHILAQLCPDEARILRLLYNDGPQPAIDVRTSRPFGVGAETVAAGVSMIPEVAGCRHVDRIASYLGNLNRLGLIWFSKEQVEVRRYELLQVQPRLIEAMDTAGRYAKTVRRRVEITPLGRDFYAASFTTGQ
ncbi:hypothetical protein GCM10027289_19550 [Tsukamurella serpentis]